jgi:hypothetical protein
MSDRLRTLGDVVVTAGEGLRIVDSDGQDAAGTFGRSDAPGLIRIVGSQTIAAHQRLALQLSGEDDNESDQLQVSGTLTIEEGSAIDIGLAEGLKPRLARSYGLIEAGSVVGHFESGTGLFGYDDGSSLLELSPVLDGELEVGLSLEVVKRPAADTLRITAHSQADKDTLGTFFNSPYFGSGKFYNAGMTVQAADFVTVDGRFTLSSSVRQIAVSKGGAVTAHSWIVGGNDLHAFVGLNGPYRLDSDRDGSLVGEKTNPSAAGFELAGLDLGLALFQDTVQVGSLPARTWLSLSATAASATELGLPLVDIRAEDLKLEVNMGSDGSVVDYSTPLSIATGGKLADGSSGIPEYLFVNRRVEEFGDEFAWVELDVGEV